MSIAKKKHIAPDPLTPDPSGVINPESKESKVLRIAWYTFACQKTCQFCRRTFWKVHLVFSWGKAGEASMSKGWGLRWEIQTWQPAGIGDWELWKMHGNSMLYTKRSTGFVNVTTQRTRRCIYTTFKNKNKKRKHHRFPCPPNRIQHFTLSCCKAGSGML